MAAVVPAVSVGLGAISTFNAISQQNKQARAQEDALHNQELDAATRLALAKENWQFTREAAQHVKDKELALNVAQRKQAMAQLQQQSVEQRLSSIQSQTEQASIKSQAKATADQLVTQAFQTKAQTEMQNANELEQVNQAAANGQGQLNASKAAGTSSLAKEQGVLLGTADLAGRVSGNAQLRTGAANEQLGYNQRTGANVIAGADVQAGYLASTDRLQQAATAAGLIANKKQINLTSQRNKIGIVTAYKSRLAGGTMDYLNQTIDTQGQLNQIAAQRANIQRPGFLTAAAGIAQVGIQAYGSGLFNFGGGGTTGGVKNATKTKTNTIVTPSSVMIDTYPPGYGTTNPPISSYPPVNASIATNG